MQSFGHAYIFSYSKPSTFIVFLTSYIDLGGVLLFGKISARTSNKGENPLSDYP